MLDIYPIFKYPVSFRQFPRVVTGSWYYGGWVMSGRRYRGTYNRAIIASI